MLNAQIIKQIRLTKLESSLDRFLAEPRATMTRIEQRGTGQVLPLHFVALWIEHLMVASAYSSRDYVDALGAALWALDLWRESVKG